MHAALSPPTVRITGIRRNRFVEFDYSLGDRDLSVELIMPFAAFDEFCRRERAVVLSPEAGAEIPERLAGLYRPPG